MKLALILIVTIVFVAISDNYADRHGSNNFTWENTDHFPIIWDVRAARNILSGYYNYYGEAGSGYEDLNTIFAQAADAGINAVSLRARFDTSQPDPFIYPAEFAEDNNLMLFAGGFKTSITPDGYTYNNNLVTFLNDFQSQYNGDFVGVVAFDEPDLRYINSGNDNKWITLVSTYREQVNTLLNLPFSSLLCAAWNDDYVDIITEFCENLDLPIYNNYPCKNKYSSDFYWSANERICATDIASDGELANSTYSTQDEVVVIYDDMVEVWTYEDVEEPGALNMSKAAQFSLPAYSDLRYTASDFRAVDLNPVTASSRNSNGAVVIWDGESGLNPTVIYNNDGIIDSDLILMPASTERIFACGVGEINYPVVYPQIEDREGIIGHGDMRILVSYETSYSPPHGVRIFKKSSNGFENVIENGSILSISLPPRFEPTGCVWGSFWDHESSVPESGFVLYNNSGQYVIIHQTQYSHQRPPTEEWACTDLKFGLFPDGFSLPDDKNLIFVSRINISPSGAWNFPFIGGRDLLCCVNSSQYSHHLHWLSGTSPDSGLSERDSVQIGVPGSDIIVSAGTDRSGSQGWFSYADRLVFVSETSGNMKKVYASVDPLIFESFGETLETEPISESYYSDALFLASARVFLTRFPHRSALVWQDGEMLHSNAQLNPVDDVFYDYADYYERIWNYGIEGTNNCLIPNVQAYGRHGQQYSNYCPSIDELRYMTVSPIIRGARGVQFYGLDLAMMSGNGDEGYGSTFACPAELVNWGPSIDTENPNMIHRVHQIARELNGSIDGIDSPYAYALADSLCEAMDSSEVVHASWWGQRLIETDDNQRSFLALKNSSNGDIYVLITNDDDEQVFDPSMVLWFKDEYAINWQIHQQHGFLTHIIGSSQTIDADELSIERLMDHRSNIRIDENNTPERELTPLMISYGNMPAYSASLIWLKHTGTSPPVEEDRSSISPVLAVVYDQSTVNIECVIDGEYSDASIDVYDLSGRLIHNVWNNRSGSHDSIKTSINTADMPGGVYFVGLRVDERLFTEKFLVF